MASRSRVFLPRFDPAAEFVILKPFKLNGVTNLPGPPGKPCLFDKGQAVSARRLRQLFDIRRIGYRNNEAPTRPSRLSALNVAQAGADKALAATQRQRVEQAVAEQDREAAQQAAGQAALDAMRNGTRKRQPPEHVNGGEPPAVKEPDAAVDEEVLEEQQPEEPPLQTGGEPPPPPRYEPSEFLNLDSPQSRPKAVLAAKSGDSRKRRGGRSRKK